MTLVEVLASIFILAIAILAMASVAASSLTTVRVARDRDRATAAASAAIERIRSVNYFNVANDADDATLTGSDPFVEADSGDIDGDGDLTELIFDHDGDGPGAPEVIARHSEGVVNPYRCDQGGDPATCWGVAFEGDVSLRTFVTVHQGALEESRRVTAVVTWTDRNGTVREVRESTIVAQANRGLPVPNFDIDGETALQVKETVAPITDPNGIEICFAHNFRNLGARDSYDAKVTNVNTAYITSQVGGDTFNVNSASDSDPWEFRLWLGGDALAQDPDDRMVEDNDGDDHLESQQPVPNDGTTHLYVCVTTPDGMATTDSQADGGDGETFTAEFRSGFDPDVVRTVQYQIIVGEYDATLYLHDPDPTSNHDRASRRAPYVMDETVPTYGGATRDYDRNLDPNRNPGIYLATADGNAGTTTDGTGNTEFAGIWDFQFPESTDLGGPANFVFWSAHNDALRSGGGLQGATLTYRVTLQKLDSGGNLLGTVGTPQDVSVSHAASSGWASVSGSINLGTSVSFDTNQYLRVVIECTSTVACNVMYDHTSYKSNLHVSSPSS